MAKNKKIKLQKLGIMGFPYTVEVKKNLRDSSGSIKLDGCVNFDNHTISVDEDISYEAQYQTLWHEIIHAILLQNGKREHNEADIDMMSFAIAGLMLNHGRDLLP